MMSFSLEPGLYGLANEHFAVRAVPLTPDIDHW